MNFLMLSCKKASALIDKKTLLGLTLKERVMLKMHTAMCTACTAYNKQSRFIEHALHEHFNTGTEQLNTKELKAQIISKLN